jgi:hypothetical protein
MLKRSGIYYPGCMARVDISATPLEIETVVPVRSWEAIHKKIVPGDSLIVVSTGRTIL